MTGHERVRAGRVALALALLSGVALVLVMLATRHGMGVSPDSTQYLYAAESFARGDGLRTHWWEEGSQPLTHFPPGLPIVLATVGRLGPDLPASAALINALALVATAFFTFALARRAAAGSAVAAVAAVAGVLLARDVLQAHAMIWTEPLFLAMTLGTLLLIVRAIERDDFASWLAAAIVAGLASMVRYAAPALIGASALALLLLGRRSWGTRTWTSVAFGLLAAAPLATLLAVNSATAGAATNRDVAFHPLTLGSLRSAARTAYYWLVPLGAPSALKAAILVVTGAAFLFWLQSFIRSLRAGVEPAERTTRLMLLLFALGYAAFLTLTLVLVDAQSTPGPRLLLPLYPPLVILVVALLSDSLQVRDSRQAGLALSATLAAAVVLSTGFWVVDAHAKGLGYRSPAWMQSPLMARASALDSTTLVLSNHPGAILNLTGREVVGVPRLSNPNTLEPNRQFEREMAAVCRAAAGGRPVAYVHFTLEEQEPFLPTLEEVRRRWRSKADYESADGVLERLPLGAAAASCGH